MDSEEEEKLIFFYHPDHLGSTSYITDADGNIAQHIEYIPYGEVFVEERNNSFSTNYLFNAKELDNETGLYYYGARYLDPMGAMWLSVDPMWEKNHGITPYNYCLGNPVKLVDPDGNKERPFNSLIDIQIHEVEGFDDIYPFFNCLFFSWRTKEKPDPTILGGFSEFAKEYNIDETNLNDKSHWVDSPTKQDLANYRQLGDDEDCKVGDRVVYYFDYNNDGKFQPETKNDEAKHSAIVTAVDKDNYPSEVTSKCGDYGVERNHPCDPSWSYNKLTEQYNGETIYIKRAYFRLKQDE